MSATRTSSKQLACNGLRVRHWSNAIDSFRVDLLAVLNDRGLDEALSLAVAHLEKAEGYLAGHTGRALLDETDHTRR